MPALIELVEGIAGSSKSARLLTLYSRTLATAKSEGRLGECLWLAPNRRDTAEIGRRLVAQAGGVLFAPRVLTFADFANQVLERAASDVVPLTPGQQRTLLRRIVDRLRQKEQFAHFGPIASTTGFLDLVQSFIAELKRSETWPEVFQEACAARGAGRRDRELALVYSEYQEELRRLRLFDSEGRFWWAREKLREGEWGAFESLDLVVVDGFDDFNQTQYEILGLLAGRARRMILSLPMETPLTRPDLFAKTQGVRLELSRHARVVPAAALPEPPAAADPAPEAFRHMARNLFGNPRTTPRQADSDGLEIVAVAGQRGEILWLAARIKDLLLAGVSPHDIVVAFRDVSESADLIRQIFPAAGIPTALDHSTPLFESPVVRGVLQVLELERSDWEFERLAPLLRSGWFQPAWNPAGAAAVGRTLAELRRLQLGAGREKILSRLDLERRQSREAADRDRASEAGRLLERLDESLAPLRGSRSLANWARLLCELVDDLGILGQSAAYPEDAAHWKQAIDSLFSAAKMEQADEADPRRLDLAAFLREFSDLLKHQDQPAALIEAGAVRVLPVVEIRNLDIPYLFLAGLSEQSFPRRRADDCLYSEAERRVLNEKGLALGHHAQRTQEEMLLFYRVVTRARNRLILSYPAVSSDGAPLSPSPYLVAVRELFAPAENLRRLEEQLDPIPRPGRVLSSADLRVRAMHDALEQRPQLLAATAECAATSRSVERVFAAVDLNVRRFHEPGFTNGEGLLHDSRNTDWLREKFPLDRQYSATHLEAYGECPFRYFASHVLEVQPLEEIEFATDHGLRGLLIHSILARLHQELLEQGQPPAVPPSGEDLARRFAEILEKLLQERPATDPLQAVITDLELQTLQEWGVEYGHQWDAHIELCRATFGVIPQPVLFEVPFGSGSRGAEEVSETAPQTPPVMVAADDTTITLTGRIDRVDVGTTSKGVPVFVVVDYKSGSKKSLNRDDVLKGRNLQLPLYVLAVLQRQLAGRDVQLAQAAFWYLKAGGFTPGLREARKRGKRGEIELLGPDDWSKVETDLTKVIPRIVAGMRQGEFPVYNPDKNCMQFCPYKLACRVGQIRPLQATLAKNWTLVDAESSQDAAARPA